MIKKLAFIKSHRYCCVCHDFAGRDIAVHHIQQEAKGGPNTLENAIALCLKCHSEAGHYNSAHPIGNKYSPSELKKYRDEWWQYCKTNPPTRTRSIAEESQDIIKKAMSVATVLVSNAKKRWNFPDISSIVRMEVIKKENNLNSILSPIDMKQLISYSQKYKKLIIYGEAGIGKTTILLTLCNKLLSKSNTPIPLFIDAATWASSNKTILEYLESFPAFTTARLNAKDLSDLLEKKKLLIIINGWNEIGINFKTNARERLQQFFAGSKAARVIISTRAANDNEGDHETKWIAIKGFTWDEQKSFVLKSLPTECAESLINTLRINSKLRSVSKNPFVLNGIVSLQRKGQAIPDNIFDLLKAIIDSFETEPVRVHKLKDYPLRGYHRYYLIGLSEKMNNHASTIIIEDSARKTIKEISSKLREDGLLEQRPEPADILDTLCDYHLLYKKEDSTIRFAHQRFQEFFSACAILRRLEAINGNSEKIKAFQAEILNQPFWEDAIDLVVSKYNSNKEFQSQANHLVEVSIEVDLLFASEIFGMLSFDCNDLTSWQTIKNQIEFFHNQSFKEAKEYSFQCSAATRSSYFSPILWQLIESSDREERYHGFRLAGGISLKQLGPDSEKRIENWPDEKRKLAVYELSNLTENIKFIEKLAYTDPAIDVRAEAIHVLGVHYLAIESTISAWLQAPDPVKESQNALSIVLRFWEPSRTKLTLGLIALAYSSKNELVRRAIGLNLHKYDDGIGIEEVYKELSSQTYEQYDNTTLVDFLKEKDAKKIKKIIKNAISKGEKLTKWMCRELNSFPESAIDEIATSTINRITKEEYGRFDGIISKLVSKSFVEQLLDQGLSLTIIPFTELRQNEDKLLRLRAIENFLLHVKKSTFIKVALLKLATCNYSQTVWILKNFEREKSYEDEKKYQKIIDDHLLINDLDKLINIANIKKDSKNEFNCEVEARIAVIASNANPKRYKDIILEVTHHYNQAYHLYKKAHADWIKKSIQSQRPYPPPNQASFVMALHNCGFGILPELIEMAKSPDVSDLVCEALVAIVTEPWRKKLNRSFSPYSDYIENHLKRKKLNRVFLQPDEFHQDETDKVARLIITKLQAVISLIEDPENLDKNMQSKLSYSINMYGKYLSRVPSKIGLPTLHLILQRDGTTAYNFIKIARCFISQGEKLSKESLKTIKTIWQFEIVNQWSSGNDNHIFTDLALLHFFIEPVEEGLCQLKELLPQWIEKTPFGQIVDEIGKVHTEEGINFLIDLLSHDKMAAGFEENFFYAIYNNPLPKALEALISLVDNEITIDHFIHFNTFENPIGQRFKKESKKNTDFYNRLISIIETKSAPKYETLVSTLLSESDDQRAIELICRYLDENLYPQGGRVTKRVVLGFFNLNVHSENREGCYTVHPKANNELRKYLFTLASSPTSFRNRARSILMSLEKTRMENGRPVEESRHPDLETGYSWPAIIYKNSLQES